jgi:hypothetical protein
MNELFLAAGIQSANRKQSDNRGDQQRIKSPIGAKESKPIASEPNTEN